MKAKLVNENLNEMYSAKSYQLTKREFDYLLPVLRKKLLYIPHNKYYVISDNIDDLKDILNRLKGLYDNYSDLNSTIVYNCAKYGNLKPFRDSLNISPVV